jgi:two-component system chemotaxis response regulator CheY
MVKKVLVMDDSKVSRLFVVNYWRETHPDWQFIEAETGEKAVSLAEQHQFHAIVLDYNMPDINGLKVAELVKVKQQHCFIALLTANIQRYIQDEAELAQLYYYRKPITPDLIAQIIQDTGGYYDAVQ